MCKGVMIKEQGRVIPAQEMGGVATGPFGIKNLFMDSFRL